MLIEFSLSNYGSFADEQTLSLIASRLKDDHPNRIARVSGTQEIPVLTTAILLGKNGSGKSTLVNAMAFVRRFVQGSSREAQQGEAIPYKPNRVDRSYTGKDTSFRVLFSMMDVIYQFEFSISADRVSHETLTVADRTARFRRVYERTYDHAAGDYSYFFSDDLRGDKSVWRAATRENALFLSTAVQLNAEALRAPFDWLSRYFRAIDAASPHSNYTASECLDEAFKRKILTFLKRLDINIEDIVIEEEDVEDNSIVEAFNPEFLKKLPISVSDLRRVHKRRIKFVHTDSANTPVEFDLSDESAGTRALFSLAGPVFDTLAHGNCLIIDEVNTNLHPLVFHALVEAFFDPALNTKRAQLIFTSHDTSLLRDAYFRRDQVWFVDTDKLGRSKLVPLSDFSPRKREALERGYLGGRYGGIPYVSPSLKPVADEERELVP